jgi:hypothetical protein
MVRSVWWIRAAYLMVDRKREGGMEERRGGHLGARYTLYTLVGHTSSDLLPTRPHPLTFPPPPNQCYRPGAKPSRPELLGGHSRSNS